MWLMEDTESPLDGLTHRLGHHRLCNRTKALARARHETVNGRFKIFCVLHHIYGHDLALHSLVFRAIANITQVNIMNGINPLFSIDYVEAEIYDLT